MTQQTITVYTVTHIGSDGLVTVSAAYTEPGPAAQLAEALGGFVVQGTYFITADFREQHRQPDPGAGPVGPDAQELPE